MKIPKSTPPKRSTESQPVLPEAELLLDESEKSPAPRQSPPPSLLPVERVESPSSETPEKTLQSERPPPYESRPAPPSRKSTLPAQPAFLTASLDTQEELADQLAQMGRQLKLNALHLANSISKEKDVMEDAGVKLETNLDTMTKERTFSTPLMSPKIHTVFFDALFTIVKPRRPIAAQYSKVINSHVSTAVPESAVATAFAEALKEVQVLKPAYEGGKDSWWSEVIRRTALKAGADANDVNKHLPQMTYHLLNVFGSKEGYVLFQDVIEAFDALKEAGVHIGLVSNTDGRMRDVLADLGVLSYFDAPIVLSEEEKVEKPSPVLWEVACRRAGIEGLAPASKSTAGEPATILHVGDELDA
ncbi:hypothetical protein FRC05_002071 [Tulasnella sp. 425]|nr:hypothetical protein FRC05_002071 [Tulasnella sp. 425]